MKNKFAFLVGMISFIVVKAQSSIAEQVNFLADKTHSGIFKTNPVRSNPYVKFSFETGGPVRSTPSCYQGKIYFGSGNSFFYSLDETTGKEIWKFKTGGAVTSSPSASKQKIYFASKDGNLYCLNSVNGKLVWKLNLGKELSYKWEFDYYLSSPTIDNNIVYIGSGDGNLYSVNAQTGKLIWKYFTGSRVRSTPAVENGIVYFGDIAGKLYAINLKTHQPKWIFETDGYKIRIEDFLFDRSALISSPTVYKNYILVGSREGCLYCVDKDSGKLNWKYDHKMSWVISTPAIYQDNVIVGTSDGHFVNSLDIKTGAENWRFKTKTPVWSSMAIAGNTIYGGDYSNNFFALDADTGEELWTFKTGDRIHASSVVKDGVVYFGSDDGMFYAIAGSANVDLKNHRIKKGVYWEVSTGYNWFPNKTDEIIRDYFVSEGYELLDSQKLKLFMEDRLRDKYSSSIIFAKNDFPSTVFTETASTDLLRDFLKGNNRLILVGENPVAYVKDKSGKLVELDYRKATKYFGIDYGGELTEAMKGLTPAYVNEEGKRFGLRGFYIPMAAVEPGQVTKVLATDENGRAALWLKNYGGREGTGLMQLWIDRQYPNGLNLIKNAAEFGFQ